MNSYFKKNIKDRVKIIMLFSNIGQNKLKLLRNKVSNFCENDTLLTRKLVHIFTTKLLFCTKRLSIVVLSITYYIKMKFYQ